MRSFLNLIFLSCRYTIWGSNASLNMVSLSNCMARYCNPENDKIPNTTKSRKQHNNHKKISILVGFVEKFLRKMYIVANCTRCEVFCFKQWCVNCFKIAQTHCTKSNCKFFTGVNSLFNFLVWIMNAARIRICVEKHADFESALNKCGSTLLVQHVE